MFSCLTDYANSENTVPCIKYVVFYIDTNYKIIDEILISIHN